METDRRFWELLAMKSANEISEEELQELDNLLTSYGTDIHYMMNVMEHYWVEINLVKESMTTLKKAELMKDLQMNKPAMPSPRKILRKRDADHNGKSFFIWSAAAILALCIAIGWFMWNPFQHTSSAMSIIAVNFGSRTKMSLPDGSFVWLNSGSKLIYPKNLECLPNREVTLYGEGYFEVKHDAAHPFIIHTDYLDVKDLGTTFNLKAYPGEKQATATLISGSIAVSIKDDPGRTIILKPHEKISFFADVHGIFLQKDQREADKKEEGTLRALPLHDNRMEITDVQPVITPHGDTILSETAWMNNEMVFQGEKFSQLAERMERWYNTTIHIQNADIANYSFTGIFDGETLTQALDELKMTRKFSFEINNDTVTINK